MWRITAVINLAVAKPTKTVLNMHHATDPTSFSSKITSPELPH
jgi:hypothetical protein